MRGVSYEKHTIWASDLAMTFVFQLVYLSRLYNRQTLSNFVLGEKFLAYVINTIFGITILTTLTNIRNLI